MGVARVGVANPQYKNSYSWYLPQHALQGVKQPKGKAGLKCKSCGEKVPQDMLSVGAGSKSANVCAACYESLLGEQQPGDAGEQQDRRPAEDPDEQVRVAQRDEHDDEDQRDPERDRSEIARVLGA